ncbi:hypothetical protein AAMO2058_000724400 [Amorphochlora amoebiformis]
MRVLSVSLSANILLACVALFMVSYRSLGIASPASRSAFRAPMTLPARACRQASPYLTARQRSLAVRADTYRITLKTPTGDHEIDCPSDMFILDKAEMDGIALPYSCRAGFCVSCAGIQENGSVDQSEQTFLKQEQVDQGIVLTCFARPTSDGVIRTHVESELNL